MNEKYNGWANWDTWECFNMIGNDEEIYLHAMFQINKKSQYGEPNYSSMIDLIQDWYIDNDIDLSKRINFNNVNWNEITKALNVG